MRPYFLLALMALGTTGPASAASIPLAWDANTETDLAGYNLYLSTISLLSSATAQATSSSLTAKRQLAGLATTATAAALNDLTTYYFRLTAYNASGKESGFNVNSALQPAEISAFTPDATAPSAPSSLALNNPTLSSLNLAWSAATDNAAVAGYRLDVSLNSAFSSFVTGYQSKDLGKVTNTSITGLSAGTAYYARLRAYDAAGNISANSATASAATAATASSWQQALQGKFDIVETFDNLQDWTGAKGGGNYYGYANTPKKLDGSNSQWTYYSSWSNSPGGPWIGNFGPGGSITGKSAVIDIGGGEGPSRLGLYFGDGSASSGYSDIYVFYRVKYPQNEWPTSIVDGLGSYVEGQPWAYWFSWKANTLNMGCTGVNAATECSGAEPYSNYHLVPHVKSHNSHLYYDIEPTGVGSGTLNPIWTSGYDVPRNTWAGVEFHYRNYPSGSALKTDMEVWIYDANGTSHQVLSGATFDYTGLQPGTDKWNFFFLGGNNSSSYSWGPTMRSAYHVDDFIIHDARIGPAYFSAWDAFQGGGVADTQAPSAPSGITLAGPTSASLNASWTASTDNVAVAGYRLDVSINSSFSSFVTGYQNKDLGKVTSAGITGLSSNTAYYARLRAYDAAGNTSANSAAATGATLPQTNGAGYYVDSVAGNDANAGTQAAPWQTVNKVNNAALPAGSFVYFKAGGNYGSTVLTPKSGTAGNPVTYASYGTGAKPVMGALNASDKSYVTVKNIKFTAGSGTVVALATAHHIIIDGCDVYSTASSWSPAVQILTNAHHNQIVNSNLSLVASKVMNDVINLRNYADYNLIEGNTIRISSGHTAVGLEGVSGSTGSGTAHYNVIRNNNIISSGGSLFSTMSNSDYNVIEGNTLSGCGTSSTARTEGGLTIDTRNNIIRKNILKDKACVDSRGLMMESNAGSGYPNIVQYNHVYNNVISNIATGGQGIYLGTNGDAGVSTDHNYFKNNAVYNNGGTWLQTDQDGSLPQSSLNIQIFVPNNGAVHNNFFSHNLFYKSNDANIMWVNGSYMSVASAQVWNSTLYSDNLQADPMLDDGFRPNSGSPVIDAGDFLTTVASANGSGPSFIVADAGYFMDGFGVVAGDVIRVGNQTATITDIDYASNKITVASAISWTSGAPVSLPYNGNKPDIGAFEYGGTTPPADTTAPTASITAPAAGSTVSGSISMTASASDNVGVSKVEFYVDGSLKATDTASPYDYSLDTTQLSNGSHALLAKAHDAAGNVGQSAQVSVTVANTAADTTAPSVPSSLTLSNPTASSLNLAWTASTDNVAVAGYRLDVSLNSAFSSFVAGYQSKDLGKVTSASITGLSANTAYYARLRAYDAAGNTSANSAAAWARTTALPDILAPTAAIISPANGANVSGTVNVAATASDNTGVVKLEFYIDGLLKSTLTSAPYAYSLDASALALGAHTLLVKAYDAAGNSGQQSISVNVVSSSGTKLPPGQAKSRKRFLSPSSPTGATFETATKVEIFNMRGKKVFEATSTNGAPITWTGKESGKMVESGAYMARITDASGAKQHQTIVVVK